MKFKFGLAILFMASLFLPFTVCGRTDHNYQRDCMLMALHVMKVRFIPSLGQRVDQTERTRRLQAFAEQLATDHPTSCALFVYQGHLACGLQQVSTTGIVVPGVAALVVRNGQCLYLSGDLTVAEFENLYRTALSASWVSSRPPALRH
jgi:hypothetical protein